MATTVDGRVTAMTMTAPFPSTLTPRASLRKRDQTNCDGVGTWTCNIGTCYSGRDGWIGCCSVSSCAARTTCIPYNPNGMYNCDVNTGGCLACSQSNAPACVTETNALMDQYIMYCGGVAKEVTLSYTNLVVTGSMATPGSMQVIETMFPSAALSSLINDGGSNIASGTSTLSTSIPSLISFSSSLAHSTSKSSTATSTTSPTSISPFTNQSTQPVINAHSSSSLSAGDVAGIAVGSIFALLILLAIAIFYLTRYRRRRQSHEQSITPRGTLGGATLLNESPPTPIYHTKSKWDSADGNVLGIHNTNHQEREGMLGPRSEQPPMVSAPWSPNSIAFASEEESSELDGSPTRQHESSAKDKRENGGGVGLLPSSLVAGQQLQVQHQRASTSVSELESVSPSENRDENGNGNGQLSPMTISSEIIGATNGMTARGSWKGYMSAETALAGGWNNDGEK